MHHSPRPPLPAALIALFVIPCALAQETTAGLVGAVKDPSGAVIVGASIEVSSPALIGIRKVETDAAGNYRLAALPPGEYTMTVTAAGFRTFRQTGIYLEAGRLPSVDVGLQIGAVAEQVEVTASAVLLDSTQSRVAVTVDQRVLQNIPTGRSFQSLVPFAPGARMEPLQSNPGDRAGGAGFQIDGASDAENVYLVDGVNVTNIALGGVGQNFNMEWIEEVQIKSSSFEAEHGGALGGVINAVAKRGSNDWHGELLAYLRTNGLNANDGDRTLRTNPLLPSLNNATRTDAVPEYYMAKKDERTIVEPGYHVGGPLWRDKLWLFSSYVPSIDTTRRTTNFIGANPGPRALTSSTTQHNAYNRLDYGPLSQLRLYGAWKYSYWRQTGTLGGLDSAAGQRNTGATTDPNTLRPDAGTVNPLALYTFGGDWTPTSKLVVSARFGYFFQNQEQRGTPVGIRYLYGNTVNAASRDLAGQPFPGSTFNTQGFANIPNNLATVYDAWKRHSLNLDASYFGHFGGTHVFKSGYFWQRQRNEVLRTFLGGYVGLNWGKDYQPIGSTSACDQIVQQNLANFGKSICQGRYGVFVVGLGGTMMGATQLYAHALYLQDNWTVGRGLTLNIGVRFDQERQPPYDPSYPTVEFGWGNKIAPRIGAAYDLLEKRKVKLYASYGKFFDIMKMDLVRYGGGASAFGTFYGHQCFYALDDPDYTKITPTYPIGGGCPPSGPAPGVNARFIENLGTSGLYQLDPRDPNISPTMKPMLQHEFVAGAEWAITPRWSFEARFSRKILDSTIEDMAITDALGYYIGNPGTPYADLLHRPVIIPNDQGDNYLNTVPFCAECPPTVPAIRRYNGVEFRVAKRGLGRWFGAVSYTYSSLTGNYAGLSNTDPTDGAGGRHAPNLERSFDVPTMTYLPNGQIDDGPLATDRPHTAKIYGFYRQKWAGMETLLGATQAAYQGTPINTCLPVVGTSSACQWAEGRDNFVKFTRAANGDFIKGDVVKDSRTDPYFQTDLFVRHEVKVSKERENMKMALEINLANLFNQRAAVGYWEFAVPGRAIFPARAKRFPGDPGVDFAKVMSPYNYVDALNGTGAFAGNVPGTNTRIQSPLTVASRYGLPGLFQTARTIRLGLQFSF